MVNTVEMDEISLERSNFINAAGGVGDWELCAGQFRLLTYRIETFSVEA